MSKQLVFATLLLAGFACGSARAQTASNCTSPRTSSSAPTQPVQPSSAGVQGFSSSGVTGISSGGGFSSGGVVGPSAAGASQYNSSSQTRGRTFVSSWSDSKGRGFTNVSGFVSSADYASMTIMTPDNQLFRILLPQDGKYRRIPYTGESVQATLSSVGQAQGFYKIVSAQRGGVTTSQSEIPGLTQLTGVVGKGFTASGQGTPGQFVPSQDTGASAGPPAYSWP